MRLFRFVGVDEANRADGIVRRADLAARVGETTVVKPPGFVFRGRRGLAQPVAKRPQDERPEPGRFVIDSAGTSTGTVLTDGLGTATGPVWGNDERGFFSPKPGMEMTTPRQPWRMRKRRNAAGHAP